MFFDRLFNRGQSHQSLVSSVEIKDGKVVNQFTWQKNSNGGLINEDKSLVGVAVNELPSGYKKRTEYGNA